MVETLILWNLIRTRDELKSTDLEDSGAWFIIPALVLTALLWPIGLLITARKYFELSWRRSILSTVVITTLILWLVPVAYFAISALLFVVAVWYFGNDEG